MFDIEDYNYDLPPGLIAQVPSSRRDQSRLLVMDRAEKSLSHSHFFDLPTLLRSGDLLVINDTRVVPARLFGHKESGGNVEILVLQHQVSAHEDPATRSCLLKSSKPPRKGSLILFDSGVSGKVQEIYGGGLVTITFKGHLSIDALMEEKGRIPLPPYIKRGKEESSPADRERYQTIFSNKNGAIAAPTAGLHFTENLIGKLREAGIQVSSLTLHVGYGTFRPVRTSDIRLHELGEEIYIIGSETARAVNSTRESGGRIVAVGTTVVRALETAVNRDGYVSAGEGKTGLFITPGFTFRVVDALITNFHLPKSSLLFLVASFAGLDLVKEAYALAVSERYKFYSYGDAMLIQ